jgi:hypothetical protein
MVVGQEGASIADRACNLCKPQHLGLLGLRGLLRDRGLMHLCPELGADRQRPQHTAAAFASPFTQRWHLAIPAAMITAVHASLQSRARPQGPRQPLLAPELQAASRMPAGRGNTPPPDAWRLYRPDGQPQYPSLRRSRADVDRWGQCRARADTSLPNRVAYAWQDLPHPPPIFPSSTAVVTGTTATAPATLSTSPGAAPAPASDACGASH